jgi:hypothetical protein
MSDSEKEKKETREKLDWRDYLALAVALLTTTLLPIIVIIIVLIVIVIVASLTVF